jgi:hypothetical protein
VRRAAGLRPVRALGPERTWIALRLRGSSAGS